MGAMLALAACNGGGSGSTPAAVPNISGDYIGTLQDAQAGSGNAAGTLAQHGGSAGGSISAALPAGSQAYQLSLSVTASNAFTGSIVIDKLDGTTCTFRTNGSYDPAANVISGAYTAVTNCSGDTGTYTLTQECLDTVTSEKRRPMGLAHC